MEEAVLQKPFSLSKMVSNQKKEIVLVLMNGNETERHHNLFKHFFDFNRPFSKFGSETERYVFAAA